MIEQSKSLKQICPRKVSIIGCGSVGMTTAYALLLKGLVNELVLLSRDLKKAEGEKLDLEHGLGFLKHSKIVATDNYADVKDSDIVVVTAGASQNPGDTRLDLLEKNIAIIESIIPKIIQASPESVILMISNPIDILTYKAYLLAQQLVKLPKGKIFGTGTTLDTARFRFHLSEIFKVHPRSIHAYILGEHGDSSFPVLSSASIGGQLLKDFPGFSQEKVDQAYQQARDAAYKIAAAKGSTYYAIAVVTVKVIETILLDAKTILPVSVPLHNFYGHSGMAVSVPCVIGKHGVEKVIKLDLDQQERRQLAASVNKLKAVFQ